VYDVGAGGGVTELPGAQDYFLTTARLGFRCWSDKDLALAIGLWGDEKVTALIGGPFTTEMVKARLASEIAHMREYAVQYWPIFFLQSGEHAGCAGLRSYRVEERVYELGLHLRSKFWWQGFATEAGHAVIAHGFDDLRAEALFAGHNPANHMSRRLLLKLEFVYTRDELYPPTGLMHPSYILRKATRPGGV
jgi:[ribosomal protein S5]-alanine N-acetyltransferase